ncbi:MAG: hypothetical protein AVDCRST_MAG93-1251, partial [uncultured Chloroflexia bacterium]
DRRRGTRDYATACSVCSWRCTLVGPSDVSSGRRRRRAV